MSGEELEAWEGVLMPDAWHLAGLGGVIGFLVTKYGPESVMLSP